MVGLVIGEMVGSGSIYPGLLMSDNSTDGWIGDRRDGGVGFYLVRRDPGLLMSDNSTGGWIGDRRDGGVGFYLSWSTDVRQLNRWLDW